MKTCDKHWGDMKEAIRVRGLEKLVSKTPEEVMERAVAQIIKFSQLAAYDPLMSSYVQLRTYIVKRLDAKLEDSDSCHFCAIDEKLNVSDGRLPSIALINEAMDAELQFAVSNKLIEEAPGGQA